MNIKKTLFAALVAMAGMTASAQNAPEYEYVFQPHWYIQGQVGGQYTLGEVSFGDLLSPNAQLAVGYQFNKVVGARLALNAWQSKGGSDSFYFEGSEDYLWKWNYVAPTIDATFDLTNLFLSYNPQRPVSVGVFAGIGANVAWGNDEAGQVRKDMALAYNNKVSESQLLRKYWDGTHAKLAARFGANVDFRLNDRWKAGVEVSFNTTGDSYNSKKAGNLDWYYNALVGVKYALGDTYQKVERPQLVNPYLSDLEQARADLARAKADLVKAQERMRQQPVTNAVAQIKEKETIKREVFFTTPGNTKISEEQMFKVMEVADFLVKHPEAKVTVTGYADKGTGNPKLNMSLSQKRANVVADILVKKYNIAADRVIIDAKGDTVQPFSVDEKLNRVSICIAE